MKKMLFALAIAACMALPAAAAEDAKDEQKPAQPPRMEKPVKKEKNPFETQLRKIEKLQEKRFKTESTSKRDEISKEIKKEETKLKETVEKQTDKLDKALERAEKKLDSAKDDKSKAVIEAEVEKLKARRQQIIDWSKESFANQNKDKK